MSTTTELNVRAEDERVVAAERMARQGVRPESMATLTLLPLEECELICERTPDYRPRKAHRPAPPRPPRPKRPERPPRILLGDLARQKMQEWAQQDAIQEGGAV